MVRVRVPDTLRSVVDPTDPVVPRDAASIVVVRDGADGLEAYLLRRQATMSFAAGQYVFPGGRLDPADADPDVPWAGPPASRFAEQLGTTEEHGRALVVAAVRETFEEAGVLLAGPDGTSVVDDVSGPEWLAARRALEQHETSLSAFLRERGLVLRADLLGAWSRWITPAHSHQRYDTRFFVARMPAGQEVGDLPGEADRCVWVPVGTLLSSEQADAAGLMPPQHQTLRQLARHDADALLEVAHGRPVLLAEPRLVADDEGVWLETDLGEYE